MSVGVAIDFWSVIGETSFNTCGFYWMVFGMWILGRVLGVG